MVHSILVTGATGMLGRELTRALLAASDVELVVLTHRPAPIARRYLGLDARAARRVRVVSGNVTASDLGLDRALRRELSSRVDAILHAAALTRFDAPLAASRRVNVGGTKNVLAFAGSCALLDRFAFVSTVYVSGARTGTVLEEEWAHDAGFVNSYERAKHEAEGVVRASSLPAAIYRLSTLVGNAADGATARFTVPHQALRLIYLGLAPLVAGNPDCVVDLIPTDMAARTVATLFLARFQPRTFHVVAGPERSFTLDGVIATSWDALAQADPEWRRRMRPRPVVCEPAVFAEALRGARDTDNVLFLKAFETIASYCGQFSRPKVFAASALRALVPEHEAALPHAREYYPRVVAYCVRTGWGRRAA